MNPTQPKKLIAGDVLQPGDLRAERRGPIDGYITGRTHTDRPDKAPFPIDACNVGQVVLPADLMLANYYRP